MKGKARQKVKQKKGIRLRKTQRNINGTGQDKRQNTRKTKNYKAKYNIDDQEKRK